MRKSLFTSRAERSLGREELQPHIYPHEEVQITSYLTGLLADICFLLPFLLSPIARENFYLELEYVKNYTLNLT